MSISSSRGRKGAWLFPTLILGATILQKIAIPGTGGVLPLSTFLLVAATGYGFVSGILQIEQKRLLTYITFMASTCITVLLTQQREISLSSWYFLWVMQAPLVFRLASNFDMGPILRFLNNLLTVFAIIGPIQFFAQTVVGSETAFFLDYHLPDGLLLQGFNVLNPIYWSSPIFKSNGFFFAEPSFFCQFIAIGTTIELLTQRRIHRLAIYAAGMISSYSGTGLLMLALFVPYLIISQRRFLLLLSCIGGLAVIWLFGSILQLELITQRIDEFSDPQSSAFARFISMYYLLQASFSGNSFAIFFGFGPGTIAESYTRFNFEIFDPTWAKLIYEYGVIGFTFYMFFFWVSFFSVRSPFRFPVGLTYFFLGGYLFNATILTLVVILVSWMPTRSIERVDKTSSARTRLRIRQAI